VADDASDDVLPAALLLPFLREILPVPVLLFLVGRELLVLLFDDEYPPEDAVNEAVRPVLPVDADKDDDEEGRVRLGILRYLFFLLDADRLFRLLLLPPPPPLVVSHTITVPFLSS
jgi:hypothetical protein